MFVAKVLQNKKRAKMCEHHCLTHLFHYPADTGECNLMPNSCLHLIDSTNIPSKEILY